MSKHGCDGKSLLAKTKRRRPKTADLLERFPQRHLDIWKPRLGAYALPKRKCSTVINGAYRFTDDLTHTGLPYRLHTSHDRAALIYCIAGWLRTTYEGEFPEAIRNGSCLSLAAQHHALLLRIIKTSNRND